MAKYPLSVLDGTASDALATILELHLAPDAKILDPTCGERIMWQGVDEYDITFSDYEMQFNLDVSRAAYLQDLFKIPEERPEWLGAFDAVVYDPPYMFGVSKSKDPRAAAYGASYAQSYEALQRYMSAINCFGALTRCLKPGGILILKCSDQYVVKEKKFYLHTYQWLTQMQTAFDVVDHFIYRYKRVSPTAYQVKDRGANIICHTDFYVGRRTYPDVFFS